MLRREAKRDLRAAIRERDGQPEHLNWQAEVEEMDRQFDPWRGARHVTYRGRRIYLTHGQQERMAATLAENGCAAPLALTF